MAYFIDLFSPETYEAFKRSPQNVSGFRLRHKNLAQRINAGDKFVCYMTKLSRWVGVLEILSESYIDDSPIFYPKNDPFVVRFRVKPIVLLDVEKGIPIHEDLIWQSLSFTRDLEKKSIAWTGKVRGSLVQLDDNDGEFLEKTLCGQMRGGTVYEVDPEEYKKLSVHPVQRADKVVLVSVPEKPAEESLEQSDKEPRESIRIQALLADLGSRMGMSIWIPKSDRGGVLREWKSANNHLLEKLPLNYDDTTLKTIEQIDLLWLRGRSIIRAFEVEHTTAV